MTNSSPIPTRPIERDVSRRRKFAVLIAEDQDVVAEHNEDITQFLSITALPGFLIPEDVRIAPEG